MPCHRSFAPCSLVLLPLLALPNAGCRPRAFNDGAKTQSCDGDSVCKSFSARERAMCHELGGGGACDTDRWSRPFYEKIVARLGEQPQPDDPVEITAPTNCHVIIAGGTTAALAAALTAAREGKGIGLHVCLVEPTNWPGGQLTASAVPAIDFAWHQTNGVNVKGLGANPANIPKEFQSWVKEIGNPGGCWVSRNCFEPAAILKPIRAAIQGLPNLHVLTDTVVKSVATRNSDGGRIVESVDIIRRVPRSNLQAEGYDAFLSADMRDWYNPESSSRFLKKRFTLKTDRAAGPVVIDASEWGELLVLSGASYVQGIEPSQTSREGNDRCGQAFVYPFVMKINSSAVSEPVTAGDHPEFYGVGSHNWEKIWTYRRIRGSGEPAAGQLSLQNWNPGNDYGYRYLLVSKADARAETASWQGGVDYTALAEAERHALGWFKWYKDKAPENIRGRLSLERGVLGTATGLSKFPYVRDTRRSIGIGDFVMTTSHIQGTGTTGTRFDDRVGIGAYAMDIHGMNSSTGCAYPSFDHATLPFYLPLRAHTNRDVANLLVAGKTMAQTFLVNSATRLQPIEWSSGIAAGAAAAALVGGGLSTTSQLVERPGLVQELAKKHGPIDWSL